MAKENSLFLLIRSLSKSEKRYFKLFCTREASGNNYLKLFDAIDQQVNYDEAAIKAAFSGEKFVRQMHVTKNYLAKLILKSLRNFHTGFSKDAELKDALRNVELLYNKELVNHSRRELARAEAIARSNEMDTALVEISNWRRKLEQAAQPHNYAAFRAVIEEQCNAIKRLENTNAYWQLAIEVSGNVFSSAGAPLTNANLLNDPAGAHTLEAKVIHYNITYLRLLQQDKQTEAEQKLFELIGLLERHPDRLRDEPGLYVSSINNLLSFLVFTKKYSRAIELIQKAKFVYDSWSITSENRSLLRQIIRTYNIELEIHRDLKSYDRQANFIESTESFVNANTHKMPREYLVSFWFQLATIHFMRKDFRRSLYWINQLLNARFKGIRNDLIVQTQLLNLIVHLEQQNLFVLRYFVDSTRRYMKKVKDIQPYENILLKFFIRIAKVPLFEYKEAFVELKEALFPENRPSLIPDDAQGYIDYSAWINEKATKGFRKPPA
jgi:hypothetical protein